MLAPGAKGWIKKYFDLVDKGEFELEVNRPEELRKLHFMHLTLSASGIVFGFPSELIFAKKLDQRDWTIEEKLRVLLFEAHLFVYLQVKNSPSFDQKEFLKTLYAFYEHHDARSIKDVFTFFLKESSEEKIERILSKRVEIKTNLLDNKWWINSLSNVFSYLDVILFDDFVHKEKDQALKSYSNYAMNALTAITLSAYSDGVIEDKEKTLFKVFLASANLDDEDREKAKSRFQKGARMEDFSYFVKNHWLLKRFLLDVAILTSLADNELVDVELEFLKALCDYFEISHHELEENLSLVENLLLRTQHEVEFMKDSPSYEKVYSSLSKRWAKVLMRNKDKLAVELKESKEFIYLVKKSASHELSAEEKETLREQFKDIVKSIPALAIFMLPGGLILLPLVLKIIPDLVPSAFKENEIDKENNEKE